MTILRRGTWLLIMSLPAAVATVGSGSASPAGDRDLRRELTRMGKEDQLHRDEMMSLMKRGLGDPEVQRRFAEVTQVQDEIDRRNMERLAGILQQQGWPGISRVGKKASGAAFLILQHAGLEDQKRYFPLLKAAAVLKEASAADTAMLEDRILMREGKKQVYGTQLSTNKTTGKLELWPIENEATVDARRATVGLPSLAEYLKYFDLDSPAAAKKK
jgi:hypothetical protein